jgi:hypothetical protein
MKARTISAILAALLLSACASARAEGEVRGKHKIPRDASEFEQRLGGAKLYLPDRENYWRIAIGGYAFLSAVARDKHSGRVVYWKDPSDFKVELHRLEGIDIAPDDPARYVKDIDTPEPALPTGAHWVSEQAVYMFEFEQGEPREFARVAQWAQFGGSAFWVDGTLRFVLVIQSGSALGTIIDASFFGRIYKTADGHSRAATWGWLLTQKEGSIPLWRYRVLDFRHPKWNDIAKRVGRDVGKGGDEEEGRNLDAATARIVAQLAGLIQ